MSSPRVTFNLTCGKGVTELQNLANLRLSSFAESHQMQQKNFDVSPSWDESPCVTRSLSNFLLFCPFRITPSQHRGNLAVLTLHPSLTTAQGLGLEILLTFVLVFTVFACSATHPLAEGTPLPPGFLTQPLSVGLSVTLAHLVGVSCFTLVYLWFLPLVFTVSVCSNTHPMAYGSPYFLASSLSHSV